MPETPRVLALDPGLHIKTSMTSLRPGSKQAVDQQAVFDVATSHAIEVQLHHPDVVFVPGSSVSPDRHLPIRDDSGVPFRT
jgi:hypothetical protein